MLDILLGIIGLVLLVPIAIAFTAMLSATALVAFLVAGVVSIVLCVVQLVRSLTDRKGD